MVRDLSKPFEPCQRLGCIGSGSRSSPESRVLAPEPGSRRRRSHPWICPAAVESSALVRIADETQVDLIVDRTQALLGAVCFAALAREGAMLSYDTVVALARSIAEQVIEQA